MLVWRKLTEHRLRSTLTALAVTLGVAMLLAAAIVGQAAGQRASELSVDGVRTEIGGRVGFNTAFIQGGLALVGLMVLFAACFVILNAFAMTITGRRQEIGALRALGMTRRQVTRTVLAEAGVLGLIGAALGLIVGLAMAWGIMYARDLDSVPFTVPWWGVVFSPLIGLSVTLIGALQPALQASRIPPVVAVRSGARSSHGWYVRTGGRLGALVAVLILPALAIYGLVGRPDIWKAMAATGIGYAGLLVAMVLLLPALVAVLARLCRPLLIRWLGTSGRLAADNLTRNRLRSALTAGALVAGLTMIVATSGLLTLFLEGSIGLIGSAMHEDMVVTSDLVGMMTTGEMSLENIYQSMADLTIDEEVADALAPLADAGTVKLQRAGIAPVPPELATVPTGDVSAGMFVDLDTFIDIGNFDFYEGDPETALAWASQGAVVLLQPLAAERLGVSVGDLLSVETPRGEIEFTVAGIGGSGLFSPIFAYADGEAYFDLAGLFQLGIVVAEGQNTDVILAQVRELVRPFPGVQVVEDVGGIVDEAARLFDQFRALLSALLSLAVIVAGLGVVNTMVINVTERRREIGLLRAVGGTQRQVSQSILAEAATLGLIAAVTAAGLGLLMVLVYALVVMPNGWGALGMRFDWQTARQHLLLALGDLGIAAIAALAFGPLVAGLAAFIPARQAAALDVVEATRSEQVTLKGTKCLRPNRRQRTALLLVWTMAWRNLAHSRLRTALSALAVALGVAMTVAADLVSQSMLNAISGSEHALTFLVGLLDQLDRMLLMIGVMITAAAGFLVLNAFAMAITQRSQQIGALRSVGMTRRQILWLVLVEALMVGGVGTLLGLVAGPLLGRGTISLIRALLGEGMFVFGEGATSFPVFLLAAALGMGITWLSVLVPAYRAAQVSPLAALRTGITSGVEPNPAGRAAVGGGVAIALVAYLILAPPGAWAEPPWNTRLTVLIVCLWLGALALILPWLAGGLGQLIQGPLTRLWGATGRLIADNLRRGRRRVVITILTLAVGLAMIVSTTGFIRFMFEELMRPKLEAATELSGWLVAQFDYLQGMSAYAGQGSLELTPEVVAAVRGAAQGRAEVLEWHFVVVPELSFFGSSYFSFVLDPWVHRQGGDRFFTFAEGNWQTAMPIMESGCGVLVTPLVASKNGISLGEDFQVTGANGPVTCTVAGIGSPFVGASVISSAAGELFGIREGQTQPLGLLVWPQARADREALRADLESVVARHAGTHLSEMEVMADLQISMFEKLPTMFNALLLLAIVAAALGVVNTTVISVAERRRELGVLRAVGAVRRQVMAVVVGEAALMGLVGGLVGVIAGVGITAILAVTYGGSSWGIFDLDLWPAAWRSVQPALKNGLVGLMFAPLICAAAAWLPVRSLVRGSAMETMEPLQQKGASS
jgi:ABC-type antimicrobial peptide transport system permease subunit